MDLREFFAGLLRFEGRGGPGLGFGLPRARVLSLLGAVLFGVYLLQRSPLGRFIDARVTHRLYLLSREALGRTPPFDSRLKIYALDAPAIAAVGQEFLPLDDWTRLLKMLGRNRPKVILVDKVFGYAVSPDPMRVAAFRKVLTEGPPVIAGSFFAERPISGRIRLDLNRPEFVLPSSPELGPTWIPLETGVLYGPHPDVAGAFGKVGHVHIEEDGVARPLIRIESGRYVPASMLLATGDPIVDARGLIVNGRRVPLNERGEAFVNLAPYDFYANRMYSMKGIINRARDGVPYDKIQPGDVVVLLTQMHQGDEKLRATPAGLMPAGFQLIALANSALTGSWIHPSTGEFPWIFLSVAAGGFLAVFTRGRWFWSLLLLLGSMQTAIGLLTFAYLDRMTPWLPGLLSSFAAGVFLFTERARAVGRQAERIRASLEGLIEPRKLAQLLQSPQELKVDPCSRELTILFIDIAGFSLSAETQPPKELFASLRSLLARITNIVHAHGGVIDKSLGDGLLCFFGHHYDDSPALADHAKKALDCALVIQRSALQWNSSAIERGEKVYPLRIGINTAEVYVGDLGSDLRIEFTIIGHGVNFAQRLEAACEPNSILCSAAHRDHIKQLGGPVDDFIPRMIQVKHHEELIEAYEMDTFRNDREPVKRVMHVFSEQCGLSRLEDRWNMPTASGVGLEMGGSTGRIVNFSRSGLAVSGAKFFAKGVTFPITLFSGDGTFEAGCAAAGIHYLLAEVRWGWQESDGSFLHGLQFKNLSPEQKAALLALLRAACDPATPAHSPRPVRDVA